MFDKQKRNMMFDWIYFYYFFAMDIRMAMRIDFVPQKSIGPRIMHI